MFFTTCFVLVVYNTYYQLQKMIDKLCIGCDQPKTKHEFLYIEQNNY